MNYSELKIKSTLGLLDYSFEKAKESSVYFVSRLSEYLDKDVNLDIIIGLERAESFKADAVFFRSFADGRPSLPQIYIYDNITNHKEEKEYAEIHRDLWSASEIPLYFIIDRNQIRIFDGRESVKYDPQSDTISIQEIYCVQLSEVSTALKQYNAAQFSSGDFWNSDEAKNHFLNSSTIYEKLLKSLKYVRTQLNNHANLASGLVDRVLIMSMLVKYLEENGVDENGNNLAQNFFQKQVGVKNFVECLRENKFVELAEKLAIHFNGGVFSLQDEEKEALKNVNLKELALFFEGMLYGNQLTLWQVYSFKYIPIELISNFYEEFLPKDEDTGKKLKENKTSVYTPSYLAQFLVSESLPVSVINGQKKIIDVSCGSGIFLVTAFRRLVQEWRFSHRIGGKLANTTPRILEEILLNHIYGVDNDKLATQLTIFSLNLALCSMLTPRQIWTELRFRDLKENNIYCKDFFQFIIENKKIFDLVIGNPPFSEYGEKKYLKYRRSLSEHQMDFGIKIPKYQSSLMFLDEAIRILRPSGQLCLIMPSGPLLYNKAELFRSYFFKKYNVSQIVDFSFMKSILFKNVTISTVAIFVENRVPDDKDITHIVVKRNGSNTEKIFFEFDYYDFYNVPKEIAIKSNYVWKCNLLGGARALDIVDRFTGSTNNQTVGGYLEEKRKNYSWDFEEGYFIGSKKNHANYITGHPYVVNRGFNDSGINKVEKETSTGFDRPRREKIYCPPHLLIKLSIGKERFPMALNNDYLTFRKGVLGIHCPDENLKELKSLKNYFIIHKDLLRFLIVAISAKAGGNRSIHTCSPEDFYKLPYSENLPFSDNDNIVINDAINYIFPYFDSRKNLKLDSIVKNHDPLKQFANIYCQQLNKIYQEGNKKYRLSDILDTDDCFATVVEFSDKEGSVNIYRKLSDLTQLLKYKNENYVVRRVIRMYPDQEHILIIKPKQFRYWMKSIALRDADDTFTDIINYRNGDSKY